MESEARFSTSVFIPLIPLVINNGSSFVFALKSALRHQFDFRFDLYFYLSVDLSSNLNINF